MLCPVDEVNFNFFSFSFCFRLVLIFFAVFRRIMVNGAAVLTSRSISFPFICIFMAIGGTVDYLTSTWYSFADCTSLFDSLHVDPFLSLSFFNAFHVFTHWPNTSSFLTFKVIFFLASVHLWVMVISKSKTTCPSFPHFHSGAIQSIVF